MSETLRGFFTEGTMHMKYRTVSLGTCLLVSLLLALFTGASLASATSAGVAALPIVDDYEDPAAIAAMFSYGDAGTSVNKSAVATDTVPGTAVGNKVLQIAYVSTGWGAGTGRDIPGEDWSRADGIRFWFRGDGSGVLYRLILSDNGDPNAGGDTSERFAYEWNDTTTGWRLMEIPWQLFFRDPGFQPGGAPNDGLTLTAVKGYAFALPSGNSKAIYVDDMRLVDYTEVDGFEDPAVAATLFSYGDSGTSVTKSVVVTGTVPGGAVGNSVLQVAYVSAGWGAGFGHDIPAADWSKTDGLRFWFHGNGSNALYRLILSDNGDPNAGGDTSERFAYEWNDTTTGWRLLSVPWSLFFRDPGFQPGGAPNDGLTLTAVRAYAIALPTGNSATIYLDDVQLFGGPVDVEVGFPIRALNVAEGDVASVRVSLNITTTSAVRVSYATAGGTATTGSDFVAASGVVTIPAGSQAISLTVATVDDSASEANETFTITLATPVSATLASANSAVITIVDNDAAPNPPGGGHSVIVDSYEYTGGLPSGVDGDGVPVGFVTWSFDGNSSAITLTAPAEQRPGAGAGNQVMQLSLNLGNGNWGGFSHNFENAALNQWESRDWSRYAGVSLWLYGNNTGGVLFIDIMDNRNPGATTDDAERWSVDIPDTFTGWKYIEIPFESFNRKDIGNGAPNDGFNKTAIHGYGIGGFGAAPMLNQVYYIDDLGLIPRTTVVDDYEYTTGLPNGADADGVAVGFVTWSFNSVSSAITLTVPGEQPPGAAAGNQVMQLDLNLGNGNWGGFSHNFENAARDQWVSQDWSTYEGICFWLYGNNTGGVLFVDIMDNRNPGAATDDAERWSVDIPDNFSGWKFFQLPFSSFNRKDIGNGAPNDGFNKTAVHGYGIGGFGAAPMLNQRYFVDDLTVYGNTGATPEVLEVAFAAQEFLVAEGATAAMTVSLNMASLTPVTVTYQSLESQATPERDFTPVIGTLTFTPGVTDIVIRVPTLPDAKHEDDEGVMVNLYAPQGADFGFQRRALLTIVDNDAASTAAMDDFESAHAFIGAGVTLSRTELAAGTPNALPGQGAFEQVLTARYDSAGASAKGIVRAFTAPEDWSGDAGVSFWYYGSKTGSSIRFNLLDNQITQTQEVSATHWVLRWADEFNSPAGTPPNPNNWKYEVGDGALNGIPGWGNSEFEYYTDDPANAATDGNGNLVISLKAVDTNATDLVCYYGPCRYTSARLLTQDRADFLYGKIEARIKLPPTDQSGLWPAFWALGTNINDPSVGWPQSGEIDIMEYVSRIADEIFGTLHGPGYSGGVSYGNTVSIPNLTAGFHTYTVEWAENHVVWYVDGVKYHEARNTDAFLSGKEWVYNHPFFLLLNVAIGGNFGGAISDQLTFPQNTLVDYVRVYQAADAAERFEASFVDNFTGWRWISLPFSRFVRSASQPAGAPNDGLTLTEVNGYGFSFGGASARTGQAIITTHIDQVKLESGLSIVFAPVINR
jgi:beta-glucanase (GH16 family)